MTTAPLSAAQRSTAARRSADSTEPAGHWCDGVSTTASAPDAASRSTRMPSRSTGIPMTSSPSARAAGSASSPEEGSSSASRVAPAAARTPMSSAMPCA
jgi:hypothetical protein